MTSHTKITLPSHHWTVAGETNHKPHKYSTSNG